MKTNDNNMEKQKECDVFTMVDWSGKTSMIKVQESEPNNGYGFREYISDAVRSALGEGNIHLAYYSLYHFRLTDNSLVPPFWTQRDNNDFYSRLNQVVSQQGIEPEKVKLKDAVYCLNKGIDPLAPENSSFMLEKREDYNDIIREEILSARNDRPVYYGIETDKGAVLFDDTPEGYERKQEYFEFFARCFFDPRLDVTYLKTLEVTLKDEHGLKINPDPRDLHIDKPEPYGMLHKDNYSVRDDFLTCKVDSHYDMTPNGKNFSRIAGYEDGELIGMPTNTYDIGTLLYIIDEGYPKDGLVHEYLDAFTFENDFTDIIEKLGQNGCDDSVIHKETKKKAEEILDKIYKDRRKEPADGTKNVGEELKKGVSMEKKPEPTHGVRRTLPGIRRGIPKPKKGRGL